jgi:hypothetical protein
MTRAIQRRVMTKEIDSVGLLNPEGEYCGSTRLDRGSSVFVHPTGIIGLVPTHMRRNVRLRLSQQCINCTSVKI